MRSLSKPHAMKARSNYPSAASSRTAGSRAATAASDRRCARLKIALPATCRAMAWCDGAWTTSAMRAPHLGDAARGDTCGLWQAPTGLPSACVPSVIKTNLQLGTYARGAGGKIRVIQTPSPILAARMTGGIEGRGNECLLCVRAHVLSIGKKLTTEV